MSLLDALNPAQRVAAQTIAGPLLVLAGAGSGKTRVLTYRIAHLVEEVGVPPWNILAVTFTNKASGEMRERIAQLVGDSVESIWVGTFHSICARLLRYEAEAFGIDGNFTIYDESDRRALMRRVFAQLNISEQDLAPRSVIAQISRAKNAMVDPYRFVQESGNAPGKEQIAEIYTAYEAALRQNNAFDFDDLLVEVVRQLQRHEDVLSRYQERFQYMLIDEYQDTNRPQYLLTKQLAAGHRNICCVGDDDQSIYQFRGADLRNILDFERDYPEAVTVRLEQNYRSTARILDAANAVILNNRDRKGKNLWTQSEEGELVGLIECDTDRAEARFVVDTLRRRAREIDLAPSDIALLYRTNAQSRTLEEELQRSGINYVIVGGIRFYDRKEIKDLLTYLRLLINPSDNVGLARIINEPKRGIGDTSVQRLQVYADQQALSLFAALDHLEEVPNLNSRAVKFMARFRELMRDLMTIRDELELPDLGEQVFERTGYRQMLEDEGTPEAEARQENVAQLIADMAEFTASRDESSLESFLEEKSLMVSADEAGDDSDAVTLMTLHSAKGLEFPLVFICGLEENLFPTSRAVEESRENPQAIEEERRLFYVGITRAQQLLYLTYAHQRYTYGSLRETDISRFADEVPRELLDVQSMETATAKGGSRRPQPRSRSASAPPSFEAPKKAAPKGVHYEMDAEAAVQQTNDFADFVDQEEFLAVGRWVLHSQWGRGKIIKREGSGAKTKLHIHFGKTIKRVLVAYAQLEPA